jgi:predicted RNA-binding Zn-ribbon protein involved in translation (DUF1610 family)
LGGSNGPAWCPQSRTARCESCGETWEPDDLTVPGRCPSCSNYRAIADRCEECPLTELDQLRTRSEAGRLFELIKELQFNSKHFSIPWSDVGASVGIGLSIFEEEINRKRIDEQNEQQDRWQSDELARKR